MQNVTAEVNKLDWKGFMLFAGSLVGLTLGLDLIAERSSHKGIAFSVLMLGLLLLCAYYFHAKKSPISLLPLSLFKIRTFTISIVANLFIRLCGSGIPFLLPLMLQVVFHYSAELSGWLLAPIAISSVLMKPLISPILHRLGYKTTLLLTAICLTLAIAVMALVTVDTPILVISTRPRILWRLYVCDFQCDQYLSGQRIIRTKRQCRLHYFERCSTNGDWDRHCGLLRDPWDLSRPHRRSGRTTSTIIQLYLFKCCLFWFYFDLGAHLFKSPRWSESPSLKYKAIMGAQLTI